MSYYIIILMNNMYKGKFFTLIDKYYQANKLNIVKQTKSKLFIKNDKIDDDNILEIYDDTVLIFKGYYNIAGVYDTTTFMWYWSYILDYVDQTICINKNTIHELYKYAKKNNNNNNINQQDIEDISFRTSNNSLCMNSINNILPLIKLLLYFTKSIDYILVYYDDNKIMNIYNNDNSIRNIYVIIIKKILRIILLNS